MFTDPLVLNLVDDSLSLALVPGNPNQTVRRGITRGGAIVATLTLGASPSRENPGAGGSVRHLIRTDIVVVDADGKNLGNATAITILVVPNNGANVDVAIKDAVQSNVSFLLAENDATLDAAATVDTTVLSRFINGEG